LFLQKVRQYGFGIDAQEFLAKNAIEQLYIASVNAKAVVHYREMMDALSAGAERPGPDDDAGPSSTQQLGGVAALDDALKY
jgi:hypothetical protein